MKRWKVIALIIIAFVFAAGGYGWHLYVKEPPDIRKKDAKFIMNASELVNAFREDEAKSVNQYVDKIIIVSGKVASIERCAGQITIALDGGDPLCYVACSFYSDESNSLAKLVQGASIQVKGNCTGMLTDVVLNKCSVVQ